ncbi:zinc metallopeptidase [Desulfofundulus australicus]|uniref:zinc metallopeptidase n=1 Tax=Desulfofundulus australicus TaxID=1566 RepID=UPI0009351EFF|nr:zinc metallopeptidase [Desulfofundulus australicus]
MTVFLANGNSGVIGLAFAGIWCSLLAIFLSVLVGCLIKEFGVGVVLPIIRKQDIFPMPVSCGEFARKLLQDAGVSYTVESDKFAETASCNHKEKRIVLTYDLDSRTALALYEACHEVGHAVRGPHFFKRNRSCTVMLFALAFIPGLLCGVMRWEVPVLLLVTFSFVCMSVLFFVDIWANEIGASKYGLGRLLMLPIEEVVRKLIYRRLRYEYFVITGETLAWISAYTSAGWFLYEFGRFLRGWLLC